MIILVIAKSGEVAVYSSSQQAVIVADESSGKFHYEQTQPLAQSTRQSVKDALRFAKLHQIEDTD